MKSTGDSVPQHWQTSHLLTNLRITDTTEVIKEGHNKNPELQAHA